LTGKKIKGPSRGRRMAFATNPWHWLVKENKGVLVFIENIFEGLLDINVNGFWIPRPIFYIIYS